MGTALSFSCCSCIFLVAAFFRRSAAAALAFAFFSGDNFFLFGGERAYNLSLFVSPVCRSKCFNVVVASITSTASSESSVQSGDNRMSFVTVYKNITISYTKTNLL